MIVLEKGDTPHPCVMWEKRQNLTQSNLRNFWGRPEPERYCRQMLEVMLLPPADDKYSGIPSLSSSHRAPPPTLPTVRALVISKNSGCFLPSSVFCFCQVLCNILPLFRFISSLQQNFLRWWKYSLSVPTNRVATNYRSPVLLRKWICKFF